MSSVYAISEGYQGLSLGVVHDRIDQLAQQAGLTLSWSTASSASAVAHTKIGDIPGSVQIGSSSVTITLQLPTVPIIGTVLGTGDAEQLIRPALRAALAAPAAAPVSAPVAQVIAVADQAAAHTEQITGTSPAPRRVGPPRPPVSSSGPAPSSSAVRAILASDAAITAADPQVADRPADAVQALEQQGVAVPSGVWQGDMDPLAARLRSYEFHGPNMLYTATATGTTSQELTTEETNQWLADNQRLIAASDNNPAVSVGYLVQDVAAAAVDVGQKQVFGWWDDWGKWAALALAGGIVVGGGAALVRR